MRRFGEGHAPSDLPEIDRGLLALTDLPS